MLKVSIATSEPFQVFKYTMSGKCEFMVYASFYGQWVFLIRVIIKNLVVVHSYVGLNEATIKKYIQDQEKYDIMQDKLSVKEYEDPFKG